MATAARDSIAFTLRFAVAAVFAGCAAAPGGRERLLDEMQALLERPACRDRVLEFARCLQDPRCLQLAAPFFADADGLVRRDAWTIRLDLEEQDPGAVFAAALSDPDFFLRMTAASAAGRRALGDRSVDAALERTLREEEVGSVLERAARSWLLRHPEDGARHVFELLSARGPAWIVCGLVVYAQRPQLEFADEFRRALRSDELDERILGARGLLAIGALAADDPAAAVAARRTAAEFDIYSMGIDRGHGEAHASTWGEVVRAAAAAKVVVLGESHGSVLEGSVQCALLGELRQRGVDPLTLLYERPMRREQRLPATAAELMQLDAQLIEAPPKEAPTVFERDDEARANLLRHVEEEPEGHWVVVYGNGHRESFARCLREDHIPFVAITTSPSAEMLAAAWTCAGTLAIRGRAFRFDDGTFYVAARPEIEDLLDREVMAAGDAGAGAGAAAR